MATQFIYLSGKSYWAKVFADNLDEYKEVKNAQITLALSPDQIKFLKKTGCKLTPNLDDEGQLTVRFKRRFEHKIEKFGGLPTILNPDGTPFTGKRIGNGSEVTIKVTVYDAGDTKGSRLESIRVDNLVEYVEPEGKEESTVETDTEFLVGLPF